MSEPARFGIITIAHGKPRYLHMALNLARSLRVNSPTVQLAVVTDADPKLFESLFDEVIQLNPEFGKNVEQKLHLDLYTPFEHTLFIDADSLLCGDVQPLYDAYRGRSFTADGFFTLERGMDSKQWEVDLDRVLDHFELESLPKFNGGIYYFERSETATAVFDAAREMLTCYQDFGIADFRACGPPDEILISIAMARHKQDRPLHEKEFMHTVFNVRGRLHLDTMGGGSRFNKGGAIVTPTVVHFASYGIYHPAYTRECLRLRRIIDPKPFPVVLHLAAYPFIVGWAQGRWGLMNLARKARLLLRSG